MDNTITLNGTTYELVLIDNNITGSSINTSNTPIIQIGNKRYYGVAKAEERKAEIPSTLLLKTEDGVSCAMNAKVFIYCTDSGYRDTWSASDYIQLSDSPYFKYAKAFSTGAAREQYILLNTPVEVTVTEVLAALNISFGQFKSTAYFNIFLDKIFKKEFENKFGSYANSLLHL